jgi:GNAT superfamily N-acetyltransferase
MESSIRAIFPEWYDARQVESSVRYIGHLDMQLIEDGTYFVHEADGQIVACGGWSRRNKLFAGPGASEDDNRLLDPATEPARVRAMFVHSDWTRRGLGRQILVASEEGARAEGFTRLALGATLAGLPLYRAFGFEEVGRSEVPLPDGVAVTVIAMEKAIGPALQGRPGFDRDPSGGPSPLDGFNLWRLWCAVVSALY